MGISVRAHHHRLSLPIGIHIGKKKLDHLAPQIASWPGVEGVFSPSTLEPSAARVGFGAKPQGLKSRGLGAGPQGL